MLVMNR